MNQEIDMDAPELPPKSLSKSLTRRVVLLSLFGLAGLIATTLLSFWVTLRHVEMNINQVKIEAASGFDLFFLNIQSDLLASSDGLSARPEDTNSRLLALRTRNHAFMDILLVNLQGDIIAQRNAIGRPKRTTIEEPEWLESPPAFGNVVISPVRFEGQTPYVDMAVTATDGIGLPTGLLIVRVDLTQLWDKTLDIQVGSTGYAYIAEESGQLVAFRNRRYLEPGSTLQKLVGQTPQALARSGLSLYFNTNQELVLAASQPMKTVSWYAVVEQPVREALASFFPVGTLLMVAIAITGFLLINMIRFTQIRIVAPLLSLQAIVRQMGDGPLDSRAEFRFNDELGQLGRTFNQMADEITSQTASLRESEARFRLLAENSTDMISRHTPEGIYLYASPACERLLGYSSEELLGCSAFDFIEPSSVPVVEQSLSSILEQQIVSTTIFQVRRKDGQKIWLETTSHAIRDSSSGGIIELHAVSRDVTERKRTEDALRESEERLRAIIDAAPFGAHLYELEPDGRLIFIGANRSADQILHVENEQFVGKTIEEAFPRLKNTDVPTAYRHVAASGEPFEMDQVDYDDTGIHGAFEIHAFQIGKERMAVFFRDITERKQAEDALRQSEEKFRAMIEQATEGFALVDENGLIIEWNQAKELIWGYKREEVLGQPFYEIQFQRVVPEQRTPEHYEFLKSSLLDALHTGQSPIFNRVIEAELWRPDGTRVFIEQREFPVKTDDGYRVGSMSVDITARKRAEAALQESEALYRKAIETAGAVPYREIYASDEKKPVVYQFIGEGIRQITGYGPEEFSLELWDTLVLEVHPLEDLAGYSMDEASQRVRSGQNPIWKCDFKIRARDGSIRWVFEAAVELRDEQGVSHGSIGMYQDITERKRTEAALRESESIYRKAIEAANAVPYRETFRLESGATRIDYEFLSEGIRQLTGYGPEEFSNDLFISMILERHLLDELASYPFNDALALVRNGTIPYWKCEYLIRARDGQLRWLLEASVDQRDENGILTSSIGLFQDITQRKQVEEDLKKREQEYKTLVENTPDIISRFDRQYRHIYVNPAVESEFGTPPATLLGKTHRELGQPSDKADWSESLIRQVFETGREVTFELEMPTPTGNKYYLSHGVPEFAKDGSVSSTLFIHRNITERRQAEEKIQRHLARLETLSEIDRTIASSFDLRFNLITLLNHAITQLNVDAADILLLTPGLQTLEYLAGSGFQTYAVEKTQVRLGDGHAGRAALNRESLHIADLKSGSVDLSLSHLAAENFVTYHVVPLIAKGQVRGVMEVFRRSLLRPGQDWFDFLNILAGQAAIAIDNASLFEKLQRSNDDLKLAYDATIEGWSHALDLRDRETEGHTERVVELTLQLARIAGVSEDELIHIRRGALLHDIGKMGIPDSILLKPGKLTDEEMKSMQRHPVFAFEFLSPIQYLQSAAIDIPYCHHEKWDGTGYPRGLKGLQIPLSARLFTVVDVWDALINDRPYRAAWSKEKALEYIIEQSGRHFDPQIVIDFLQIVN